MAIEYISINQLFGLNISPAIPSLLSLSTLVLAFIPDSVINISTKLWLSLVLFSLCFVTSIIVWGGVTTVKTSMQATTITIAQVVPIR